MSSCMRTDTEVTNKRLQPMRKILEECNTSGNGVVVVLGY